VAVGTCHILKRGVQFRPCIGVGKVKVFSGRESSWCNGADVIQPSRGGLDSLARCATLEAHLKVQQNLPRKGAQWQLKLHADDAVDEVLERTICVGSA